MLLTRITFAVYLDTWGFPCLIMLKIATIKESISLHSNTLPQERQFIKHYPKPVPTGLSHIAAPNPSLQKIHGYLWLLCELSQAPYPIMTMSWYDISSANLYCQIDSPCPYSTLLFIKQLKTWVGFISNKQ